MNQKMWRETTCRVFSRFLPALILLLLLPQTVAAKPLLQTYDVTEQCFGVADERMHTQDKKLSDSNDTLVRINRTNGQSSIIGLTGTVDIEAIAFDSSDTLYAANGDQLGILDLDTGTFTARPQPFGKVGGINLNNVDGLFFDTFTKTLYGVQRRGSSKADVLFQINPNTGAHISTAFNGKGYLEIANVLDSSKQVLDDADDIAVDPNNGALYAAMNRGGTGGVLAQVDTNNGQTIIIGEFKYVTGPLAGNVVDDIEGLSFFNDGQLYGSTGDNGPNDEDKNKLFRLEVPLRPGGVVTATLVGAFPANTSDPTHYTPVDFEALACLTANAFINLRKFTHTPGQTPADADIPPGPQIPAGSPVVWTYIMTNTGILTLTNISLVDDKLDAINLNGNCQPLHLILGPGDSMTCIANGSAQAGQYANTATVTAKTQEGVIFPRRTVTDVNTSHYFGSPGITVKKFINGDDADVPPGLQIPVGQPVSWTYVIRNISLVSLTSITLVDDKLGLIPCPKTQLSVGESMTCLVTGVATQGLQRNTAIVTATPTTGSAMPVTNSDQAHYTGIDTQSAVIIGTLWFDQNRSGGQPEPHEARMANVTVRLFDNNGALPTSAVSNPDGVYSFMGLVAGAYTVKVVTETLPTHVVPTYDVDPPFDHHAQVTVTAGQSRPNINFGYCQRCGTISGRVWADDDGNGTLNGQEAGLPNVALILWENGNWLTRTTTLANGDYRFTNLAAGLYTVQVEVATLPPGARPTFDPVPPPDNLATFFVVEGQSYPNSDFGYQPAPPALALKKFTNNQDADLPPGPSIVIGELVIWTYVVTNTGGTTLQKIVITDDNGTPTNTQDDFVVCEIPQLTATQSASCTDRGSAIPGQYRNLGTATGQAPNGQTTVQDRDVSHYFGTLRLLTLKKYTNGADADTLPGPTLRALDPVTWTYFVTNTGTIALSNITVTDDNGTPTDPADDLTVCTQADLLPGQSFTCRATSVAHPGQYRNLGTASGQPVDSSPSVSASDLSHYLGVPPPFAIHLKKYTNGQDADTPPGPVINEFAPVNWTYIVTNIGTLALSNITVTDDNGTRTDPTDDLIVCTLADLLPNQTFTCQATGVARQGQYRNLGTASGQPGDGSPSVTASDLSHYLGVPSPFAMRLKKYTNGQDADTPPGLVIKQFDPVNWTYIVTNIGTLALSNIRVTDDNGTPTDLNDDLTPCVIPALAAGQSVTCSAIGVAKLGQYRNVGTAIGQPVDGSPAVSVSDASHYLGVPSGSAQGKIDLEKFTNGQDVTGPPGPTVVVASPVTWRYAITNVGEVTLTAINITDDNGTPANLADDFLVCVIPVLTPGSSADCTATRTAQLGQYSNVGTASGEPVDANGLSVSQAITDTDSSYYLGVSSPITSTPHINGIAVNQAPGICVQAPGTIQWTYVITNVGQDLITKIQLSDAQLGDIRCPADTLGQGQGMTCSASTNAVVGSFSTTSWASGQLVSSDSNVSGQSVQATTTAYYFGRHAAMTVEKLINGAEADAFNDKWIPLPNTATFTYWITNTGNTLLTNLAVTDSDPRLVISCTQAQLGPGESLQCTATAPVEPGEQFSEGIFTAQPVDEQGMACGALLRLTDPVYYRGFQQNSFRLTLEPATATRDVGTTHTVTATVRNRDTGEPVVNAPIYFAVNDLRSPPVVVNTNAVGQAAFAYPGTVNLGATDTISAWLELDGNQVPDPVGPNAEPFAPATVDWNPIAVGICHDEGGTVDNPVRQLIVKVVRLPPSGAPPANPTKNCERPDPPVLGVRVGISVTDGTTFGPEFKTIGEPGVVTFVYTSTAPRPVAAQANAVTAAAASQAEQTQADTDLVNVWVELNGNGRLDAAEPFDLAEVTTAVQLVGFAAQAENDRVLLRWTTAVEIDHAGFNLYRARTLDGDYALINSQFIGAQGEGYGTSYEFVDVPPEPGQYYYKLEAISNRNVRNTYPPQVVWFATPPVSDPANRIYMPVVQR